jgi:hypothetical protein
MRGRPDPPKPTVRQIIEAALEISKWKCEDCKVPLISVWIGDEETPDLRWVECPKCNISYTPVFAFVKDG